MPADDARPAREGPGFVRRDWRGLGASVFADLREGLRYVRATSWLWATLLFALVAILFVIGPLEVLLPFAIRDNLGEGAEDYGAALATFGVGGPRDPWRSPRGGCRAVTSRT